MKKNQVVGPVLKWVGGKRQLLDVLTPLLPNKITTYCEPFVGGGALLFKLQPRTAYINDINNELIRVYEVIKITLKISLENYKNLRMNLSIFILFEIWIEIIKNISYCQILIKQLAYSI